MMTDSENALDPIDSCLDGILASEFARGFRTDSFFDMRRLRYRYSSVYGTDLDLTDSEIRNRLVRHCIFFEGVAYRPKSLLDDHQYEVIVSEVNSSLKEPGSFIFFDSLFNRLDNFLLDTRITSVGLLRAFLVHVFTTTYYINDDYISNTNGAIDISAIVSAFMRSQSVPLTFDSISSSLSSIPSSELKSILRDDPNIIEDNGRRYFHVDIVDVSSTDLSSIASYISSSIDLRGYISPKELYDSISTEFIEIFNRNSFIEPLGWRNYLSLMLKDQFNFTKYAITQLGVDITSKTIFEDFSKENDYFSIDQLVVLSKELNVPVDFDSIYLHAIRVSEDEFVSKDRVHFDVPAVDRSISKLFITDYLVISEIPDFIGFPDCNYPWSNYLVEIYVCYYSELFTLVHRNFSVDGSLGIIVSRNRDSISFYDLVSRIVADSDVPLTDDSVLEFLISKNIIKRRRFGQLSSVVDRAKLLRNRTGDD